MTGHDDHSLENAEGEQPASGPTRSFRWRRRHTLLAVLAVVVVAVAIASLVTIPYYAITPGSAQSVENLIGVPSSVNHKHKGQVLLVDVMLTPLRAIEWPWFELNPNAQIVPTNSLLGPETAGQYQIEGELDMSNAQQAATVVALTELGYKVNVRPAGALIYALLPGSPAEASLAVGDVVTEVSGHSVTSASGLGRQLVTYRPGTTVVMRVRPFLAKKSHLVNLRLSAWRLKGRGKHATLVCPPYGTHSRYPLDHVAPETGKRVGSAPCIGALQVEAHFQVGKLPFRINLASEGIIGPSAGLAFTLGLIQRLDPYDLTGGHKVAATGTMDIYGQVGPVGGVAQKTVAVRNSGAKIFFVPPAEYKVALAHGGNGLRIYAVSSLGQAIGILLHRYGGRLPARGR
ncbi:MAG: S16 family serine protease [Acidimicrobiales bacterium]